MNEDHDHVRRTADAVDLRPPQVVAADAEVQRLDAGRILLRAGCDEGQEAGGKMTHFPLPGREAKSKGLRLLSGASLVAMISGACN